jgi:uncharacterized membrane protein YccC
MAKSSSSQATKKKTNKSITFFLEEQEDQELWEDIHQAMADPEATYSSFSDFCKQALREYFRGQKQNLHLPQHPSTLTEQDPTPGGTSSAAEAVSPQISEQMAELHSLLSTLRERVEQLHAESHRVQTLEAEVSRLTQRLQDLEPQPLNQPSAPQPSSPVSPEDPLLARLVTLIEDF